MSAVAPPAPAPSTSRPTCPPGRSSSEPAAIAAPVAMPAPALPARLRRACAHLGHRAFHGLLGQPRLGPDALELLRGHELALAFGPSLLQLGRAAQHELRLRLGQLAFAADLALVCHARLIYHTPA